MRVKKMHLRQIHKEFGSTVYMFRCPGCGHNHMFTTAFDCEEARQSEIMRRGDGKAPVWSFNGNVDLPTFTPSLLVEWGDIDLPETEFSSAKHVDKKVCHSYVTDGKIQFLTDCTHSLSGQTVNLPELPDSY